MAYGNMTPATVGGVASSAANNQIITNVEDLDTRLDVVEARTVNTSGDVGTGNQRLSDRLGSGVTTAATASDRFGTGVGIGSNVTTGSATSQLTDLRTRVTATETANNHASTGHTALGTRVTALESPTAITVQAVEDGYHETTSTTMVYLTNNPLANFVAPPSGRVRVFISARATGDTSIMSFELRVGTTPGSGTQIFAPPSSASANNAAGLQNKGGLTYMISGLTGGSSYHVRTMYGSTSGALTGWSSRVVSVQPVP
jgi:hypothetical protein